MNMLAEHVLPQKKTVFISVCSLEKITLLGYPQLSSMRVKRFVASGRQPSAPPCLSATAAAVAEAP